MKVELLYITPEADKLIELAGRTAWLSFNKKSAASAEKFVKMLIKKKHYSVLEHATATFKISGVSRTMTHQLVRHRLASYTQQSQRVVNEGDLKKFTIPPSINDTDNEPGPYMIYKNAIDKCFQAYDYLIKHGINKEDARFILPNACHTQIVVTGNFRTWRHIIKMRTSKHAQWEIRETMNLVKDILNDIHPSIFGDL